MKNLQFFLYFFLIFPQIFSAVSPIFSDFLISNFTEKIPKNLIISKNFSWIFFEDEIFWTKLEKNAQFLPEFSVKIENFSKNCCLNFHEKILCFSEKNNFFVEKSEKNGIFYEKLDLIFPEKIEKCFLNLDSKKIFLLNSEKYFVLNLENFLEKKEIFLEKTENFPEKCENSETIFYVKNYQKFFLICKKNLEKIDKIFEIYSENSSIIFSEKENFIKKNYLFPSFLQIKNNFLIFSISEKNEDFIFLDYYFQKNLKFSSKIFLPKKNYLFSLKNFWAQISNSLFFTDFSGFYRSTFLCDQGFHVENKGLPSCELCPCGFKCYSNYKIKCPFQPQKGQISCASVAPGLLATKDGCTTAECPSGAFCENNELFECEEIDSFQPKKGQISCQKIEPGFYKKNNSFAEICPKNHFCRNGKIFKCEDYQIQSKIGQNECYAIVSGFYKNGNKAQICEPGFSCWMGNRTKCQKGHFSAEKAVFCQKCHGIIRKKNGLNVDCFSGILIVFTILSIFGVIFSVGFFLKNR